MFKLLRKYRNRNKLYKDSYDVLDQFCGYATCDMQGEILSKNAIISQWFGFGNMLDQLNVDSYFLRERWSEVLSGHQIQMEFEIQKTRNLYLSISFLPIQDSRNSVTGVAVIARDLSEEKKALIQAKAIKQALDLSYAFIKFDSKGYVVEANDVFIKTMGYTSIDELKGKHHSMFITPEYAQSVDYQEFWSTLNNGSLQKGTFERVRKDGEMIRLQASYSPVLDGNQQVQYVVKIAKDITDEVKAADQLKEIKDTIDLSFGFIQFDIHGNILEVNENFHQLLGYEHKEEVLGCHHSIFVEKEYKSSKEYQDFWTALGNGITQQGEFRRITRTGDPVWIQAAYTPLVNSEGEVISIVKIAADITSTKHESLIAKQQLREGVLYNLREISSSISQIASGSRDQAEKTDVASTQIERALGTASDVAQKAGLITGLANTAAKNSQLGETTISQLGVRMNQLQEVASKAEQAMTQFNTHMVQIHQVLRVIKEISSQTNLLALNASIEAAQAGDFGRGFAIIAKEVRELSENSRKSTFEIEEMIQSVQDGSQNVALSMKEVSSQVNGGLQVTSEVSDIFRQMAASTGETSNVSATILEAARRQSENMQELVRNIESIVVISEQTAAGAEEVSSASKALEEEVDRY